MATLDVWVFDSADGATTAATDLHSGGILKAGELVCVIEWRGESLAPQLHLMVSGRPARPDGAGAVGAWLADLFLGVFLEPLRAAERPDDFNLEVARPRLGVEMLTINRLRDDVTPMSSALLTTDVADLDAILDAFAAQRGVRHWRANAEFVASN